MIPGSLLAALVTHSLCVAPVPQSVVTAQVV